MNHNSSHLGRLVSACLGAFVVAVVALAPASARPDAGDAPAVAASAKDHCELERVGHLVRCGDLIFGAGAAAPVETPDADVKQAPAPFGTTSSTGGAPQAPWSFAP